MKVAIVTNDGEYVSQHFGRSRYYKIYTIEDNQIKNVELRERGTGHFARQQEQTEPHHHTQEDAQGRHGFGPDADRRHAGMAAEIGDCDVLIAGGMGAGAYESFRRAGLNVMLTDIVWIEEAVTALMEGKLKNLANERTD